MAGADCAKRWRMKLTRIQIKKIEAKNNVCVVKNSDGAYLYSVCRDAEYGWQFVTPKMVDEIGCSK